MAENMIDYVKKQGSLTFAESKFNDVDSLVLSQFSYLKFDGMVPDIDSGMEGVTVKELSERKDREKLFADERYRDVNTQLFDAMAASERYRGMKVNLYENIIDPAKETQFSAMTFFPEGAKAYVAFRGTDETIVGWKEDFNMAFMEPVMGQLIGVKYLNHAAGSFDGPFYVGGHSKGGNFAVFSAMRCEPSVQERIVRIFSHDGPGFRPEILRSDEYERIEGRVCKILPHSSLVGMLLQNQEDYEVVESKGLGVMQHNPFKWMIKDGDFVRVKDIYHGRKVMDEALNEWILKLDEEHLRLFVDTLFQVIAGAETDNLIDFTVEWKKSAAGVLNAIKEIDDGTKEILKDVLKELLEITSERMKDKLKERKLQPSGRRRDGD